MSKSMKALEVLKSLIAAYIFTGVALAILAFVIYKLELSEAVVNIVIVAIYVLSSFIGGFITGKRVKERKFAWGVALGAMYILIIYLASLLLSKNFDLVSTSNITAFLLCIGGGMLGGMLS